MSSLSPAVPSERTEQKILLLRNMKVMLDRDIAQLYGVPTKVLNQAVKRNRERFPVDFMFQLSPKAFQHWKSQIVTSNAAERMSLRRRPYAFTEQGIAMLSSVLRSRHAVLVNIAIMRTFVRLREMFLSHEELKQKLLDLEKKYDGQFAMVFEAIRSFMTQSDSPSKRRIGFRTGNEDHDI